MSVAILNDITKCIGCRACMSACKQINNLPPGDMDRLSGKTWCFIESHGKLNVRRSCMHCQDPACASVCPVGALEKTELGPVVYHEERCIGCRYCMVACPFHVPTYEWQATAPRVRKCIMCYSQRTSMGEKPACASACPTGATLFGDRDELIHEAQRRTRESPGRYYQHVYGITEAGGTSLLYLSPVSFDQLAMRKVQTDPYPKLTWNVLSKLPNVVSIAGVGLFGIAWIIRRRDELAQQRDEAQRAGEHDGTDDDRPAGGQGEGDSGRSRRGGSGGAR